MANAWILKPADIVSVTASSTALGSAINVANDYAGVIWVSAIGDLASILIDLGKNVPLDTLILFGLQGTITATVQVALATSAQGTGFSGTNTSSGVGTNNYWAGSQPFFETGAASPTSGKYVFVWSAPQGGSPPASTRYIQLGFIGLGASGAVAISRVVAGKRIQLDRNFSYGAAFGVRDLGSLDFSARGVLLRRRAKKLRTLGLTFSSIRKAEVEAITQPLLEQIGNTDMIAVLTDPALDAQRQNRAYYGALVGDLGHTWRNPAAFEAKVNLVSIF